MAATSIKITDPEGRSWNVPFEGMQVSVGRTGENTIVLEQHGVSSSHCVIGRDPTGAFWIADQGSTNGTWVAGQKVGGSTPVQPGTPIAVGGYMLELQAGAGAGAALAPGSASRPVARPIGVGVRGPLIRKSEDEHADRRFHDRVSRYAREWDEAGRPARLLLRGRNLSRALDLLEADQRGEEPLGELEESFVRASAEGRERNKYVRIAGFVGGSLAAIGLIAFLVTRDWSSDEALASAGETQGEGETGDEEGLIEVVGDGGDIVDQTRKVEITHEVIPAETVEEIALRYDVSIQALMRWNGIDESTPLQPGRELKVTVDNNKVPLPQQQITYRTEKAESWTSLARRFDVPVAKLRAYNPEVGETLEKGMELTIWIDPTPLERKKNVQIPDFEVRPDAISVGAPRDGKIINAIQFPKNDELYKRRNPRIMWCASYMAKHLQHAIASFRYTYEFEGEIVVADMSRKHGGHFPPHGSHQAGRDVDIWLPTLKGVYKQNHLTQKEYRPQSEEADWFALYGFLKALHETGAVQQVFLAYELHERVYKAAKLMGATDEELEEMIVYPRPQYVRSALLQHSPGHTHHIHVRFKCGPNDECSKGVDNDPGD